MRFFWGKKSYLIVKQDFILPVEELDVFENEIGEAMYLLNYKKLAISNDPVILFCLSNQARGEPGAYPSYPQVEAGSPVCHTDITRFTQIISF